MGARAKQLGFVCLKLKLVITRSKLGSLSQTSKAPCSCRLTWVCLSVRPCPLARDTFLLVTCEHLQRSGQMGALAAVCTPTLKSANEKHQNFRSFSDLITITRGETSWCRIPILGTFRRASSLLLEVPLAQGVTFWVPTHAPQVSVTYPGSVSTFLSKPRPWFVPGHDPLLGRIYPRGHPEVACASRVRLLPTGASTMALKPPFSSLYYCF